MKSIIQEESSVERAIKKCWEKAGKPREFSIKVFEEEEKNFIGMTRKPAKIALFFEEKKGILPQPRKQPQQQYRKRKPQRRNYRGGYSPKDRNRGRNQVGQSEKREQQKTVEKKQNEETPKYKRPKYQDQRDNRRRPLQDRDKDKENLRYKK
jgi:hypothetical protein